MIELHENAKDYPAAFKCLLEQKSKHSMILEWLKERVHYLKAQADS
jgi:hypothetical protein